MNHREPLSFTDENQEALDQPSHGAVIGAALPIVISRDYNYFSLSSSVFAFLSFCFSSM